MIHTNRVVTVGEQESIIDRPIVLYRGDREVEIEFELVGNEFTFSTDGNVIETINASHGQLVLNTPSGENMFSDIAECHDGKVAFIVTKEMIDEFIEIGFYSFQIRLFDESQVSRVTLPPILNGFDIRNPIAAEDETNVVDQGIVDYARIYKDQSNEELPTFTWDGEYNKTEWVHHDVITENKLNKIEDALYSINANVKESDVVMLNTLDQVKKDADAYVKEHMAEVEADVDEFERNLNTGVETFKMDTNTAMTTHKNEVSAELDGFSGEIESINSQLEHITKKTFVNVSDFGVKGDGVSDDTKAINNALTYAYNNKVSLVFNKGEYIISDTLKCSPLVHIVPYGEVIIKDRGDNLITLKIQSLDSESVSTDSFFTSPNINNSFGNLILIDDTKGYYKTGIFVTGKTVNDADKRNNLYLKGITFKKYHIGLHIDTQNVYINTFNKLVFVGCDYGLMVGNDVHHNSGEKIIFSDCLWANCKTAIINKSIRVELTFNECSVDMCGCCVIGGSAIKLDFNNCHFEAFGVGANYVETNSSFEGIVKVDDATNSYDRTFVNLNNCIIVCYGNHITGSESRYPSSQFFEGSRMILNLNNITLDVGELYWYRNTIIDKTELDIFKRIYMVSTNVKKVTVSNLKSVYSTKPLITSKYNVLSDATLENEELKDFVVSNKQVVEGETIDFEIVNSNNIHSLSIVKDSVLNRNCLEIQCTYDNTNSYIEMDSKNIYPIRGKNFECSLLMKGYKYKEWSNLGMNARGTIELVWYDNKDNYLSQTKVYDSYRVYRGDDEFEQENVSNFDKWMLSHSWNNDLIEIPSRADKYGIKIKLYANFGDSIYTPVYFTAFNIYNY